MMCFMNKLFFVCLLFLLFCIASPGLAAGPSSGEIDHLLTYIEESGCTFIRNGKTYSAVEGRHHIERKYEHVKSRVSSAEDFIKYAATTSSITGRLYTVICKGEEMLSGDWLHAELERFRVQLQSESEWEIDAASPELSSYCD